MFLSGGGGIRDIRPRFDAMYENEIQDRGYKMGGEFGPQLTQILAVLFKR